MEKHDKEAGASYSGDLLVEEVAVPPLVAGSLETEMKPVEDEFSDLWRELVERWKKDAARDLLETLPLRWEATRKGATKTKGGNEALLRHGFNR